jgi:putative FmdB family regulatory protein
MPTYEYACRTCAHEWEFEQSIKDDPLTECPQCHNATARRQISRGGGFILKGGGWYSDLYASGSNKPPEKSEKSGSDSEGTSKSTGESKPSGETPSATTPASPAASSSTPAAA